LPQNFAPGAAGVWHFGQTAAVALTACPQLPQNFDPGVRGDWHFVQVAAVSKQEDAAALVVKAGLIILAVWLQRQEQT